MTDTRPARRSAVRPSPIFLGLVAASLLSGWALWNTTGAAGVGLTGVILFVFVLVSWVVTLCLHEFAHAAVAYRYGDHSVLFRGYLTLNPLKYTHAVLSIVLPLVFLILGGIGLPGGAVFIDRSALRSRFASTAVSAAGPLTNAAVAVVLGVAIALREADTPFWAAISFLAFLQVTAAILNLLPVPGLDGFGIVEPYLSPAWRARAARVGSFGVLALFVLLWIPQVNSAFFAGVLGFLSLLGVPQDLVGAGYWLFRFWEAS